MKVDFTKQITIEVICGSTVNIYVKAIKNLILIDPVENMHSLPMAN